jgi:hypothetical protein
MRRSGTWVSRAAASSITGVLVLASCSQTTVNNAPCGAGTTLVNGVCEVVEAGADATSLEGGGGADSAGGSGAPTIDAGSESGALTDAATDASTDAETSDPCPAQLDYDCSGQCVAGGPPPGSCSVCPPGTGPLSNYVFSVTAPATLRTPSGASQACLEYCGPSSDCGKASGGVAQATSAIVFKVLAPGTMGALVMVNDPWWAEGPLMPELACSSVVCGDGTNRSSRSTGCLAVNGGSLVEVGTDDPNPPARNITLTLIPDYTTCPQ